MQLKIKVTYQDWFINLVVRQQEALTFIEAHISPKDCLPYTVHFLNSVPGPIPMRFLPKPPTVGSNNRQ